MRGHLPSFTLIFLYSMFSGLRSRFVVTFQSIMFMTVSCLLDFKFIGETFKSGRNSAIKNPVFSGFAPMQS